MRYSIESLGGEVDRAIEEIFGYEILYAHDGKLPKYLIFVGGLLYDKKIKILAYMFFKTCFLKRTDCCIENRH